MNNIDGMPAPCVSGQYYQEEAVWVSIDGCLEPTDVRRVPSVPESVGVEERLRHLAKCDGLLAAARSERAITSLPAQERVREQYEDPDDVTEGALRRATQMVTNAEWHFLPLLVPWRCWI